MTKQTKLARVYELSKNKMSETETLLKPTLTLDELRTLDGSSLHDSPDFQAWAGDGVITSSDGQPMIFYHGGSRGIKEFNRDNPRNTGNEQHGIYFSDRIDDARFYADNLKTAQIEEGGDAETSVYAVALKMNNPYVIDKGDEVNSHSLDQIPEGYDGIINQKSQEVVVFDPSQIYIAGEAPR